jgi:hypothetical protein
MVLSETSGGSASCAEPEPDSATGIFLFPLYLNLSPARKALTKEEDKEERKKDA